MQHWFLAKCLTLGMVVAIAAISPSAAAFVKKSDSTTGEQTTIASRFFSESARLRHTKPFSADPYTSDSEIQYARAGLTLSEAIATAKRRHGGEVLSARRAQDASGRTIYVIKILTKRGVVKKVTVRE